MNFLKIASLFSVVRVYNVIVIVLAQYLSAIFILAPKQKIWIIITDFELFILVIASSLTIASGYIINNFYDSQKDLINRPNKSMLDRVVSQKTKLQVYFGLNFFIASIAFFVSYRAVIFYSVYIFLIWFYSHKVKKMMFLGNLLASALAILPFFGILLYYKNFQEVIYFHAIFLYLLILIREIIKDLENQIGDLANNYPTLPLQMGEQTAKLTILILSVLTLLPVYFLIDVYDVGYMDLYFYSTFIALIYLNIQLFSTDQIAKYLQLHNLLKFIILAGILSILLINPSFLGKLKSIF